MPVYLIYAELKISSETERGGMRGEKADFSLDRIAIFAIICSKIR
jgi:hypothetical protein